MAYGAVVTRHLLAMSPGNERMREVSAAIQEGASAYLRRQYLIIAAVAVPLVVVLLLLQNWQTALGFVIGGTLSGVTGFVGMNLSVRANSRVAEAARGGVPPALDAAFKGGSVTGMLVVGLALLGVAGYYGFLTTTGTGDEDAVRALIGLGFGGSLISVFARLGGGIFTKAADVGADLVGKIEAGIPEDDPRNPAVIADNVGDNVGDCAGMAADLFETYAVTTVAVMLLGVLTFSGGGGEFTSAVAVYPLVIGGVAILASIIGAFAVRTKSDGVERALYRGLIVSTLLSALAFFPVTRWLMEGPLANGLGVGDTLASTSTTDLWLCSVIGIVVTALLFVITDYYTSTRFGPVRKTAAASQTGHATNIISGLAQGFQATALPAIVLVLGILAAWKLGGGGTVGIYGIGVAVMGQLSLTGLIVALDAFGPITDNAGGIAEMAELPEEVRNVTDRLDAVGNTTKAVTKGYAIGSAVLAAVVLFAAFKEEIIQETGAIAFRIDDPPVLMGLLLGGMMVCLFSALSMEAVGRAGGAVVEEVRRQFREIPGLLSFMATGQWTGPDSTVQGINDLQKSMTAKYGEGNYAPYVPLVYWAFRAMIGLGMLGVLFAIWALWLVRKGRTPKSRTVALASAVALLFPLFGISAGWIFTEMGRQPWVVFGLMKTADGVSPNLSGGLVFFTLAVFTVVIGALTLTTGSLLKRYGADQAPANPQVH